MIKKIGLILLAFASFTLFCSFSPSLDGRAVVADEGMLPKGIFARTVGYLPGDNISVTNLQKKTTIEVLVIGSIDPSDGIAILLSPEAASLLGMEKGANNVVKITKRTGQLDEAVSGTAVIGNTALLPEDNQNPELEPIQKVIDEVAREENIPSEVAATDENPIEEEESQKVIASSIMEEEPEVEFLEGNEVAESDDAPLPVEASEIAEVTQETTDVDHKASEIALVPDTESNEVSEEKNPEVEEAPLVSESTSEETPLVAEVPSEETPLVAEALDKETPVEETSMDTEVPLVAEASKDVEEVLETLVPEETLPRAKEPVAMDNSDEIVYEPIVLVPVTPNPPEESVKEEVKPVTEEVKEIAEVKPEIPIEPLYKGSDYTKYTVSGLNELQSSKFYVQIAFCSDKKNINNIIDKYAREYPVVLVPKDNTKGLLVMVGPLGVDEYATVLNRFKTYGFKDSFLRKIK